MFNDCTDLTLVHFDEREKTEIITVINSMNMGKIGLKTGLTLYKSVFDTIYHGGNYGQTSGEDGWTDYR